MLPPAFEGWKSSLVFILYFCGEVLSQDIIKEIIPNCDFGADNVDFHLYNKKNRDGVIVYLESNEIPIDSDLTTIFLVHGFNSEANTTQYLSLTYTLLDKYDVNVIYVDWKQGACGDGGITLVRLLSYPTAVSNTRKVGEKISKFINRLMTEYGIGLVDMNLVGHSLGAQVVGFAGKDLQIKKIGRIHHILGLDPAGPGFEGNSCNDRICSTDADFVQIFHTSYALGMHTEIGSIDFYFNGGRNQPGCPILDRISCSHGSSVTYLIQILKYPDCKYIGKRWNRLDFFPPRFDCSEDNCSIPGPLAAELPARGTFYVNPRDLPSFCQNRTT